MTNREKYITKRDEYDLMMVIAIYGINMNDDFCVLDAIRATGGVCGNSCQECIQKWLNEEADQPKPQWQGSLMKNFLRKE